MQNARSNSSFINLKQGFKQYLAGTSGQVAMMLALATPVLMGGVGLATDYATFNMKRSKLQEAADQAAIAGAKELSLSSGGVKTIEAAAESFAKAHLNDNSVTFSVETAVDTTAKNVKVTLNEVWTPFFAHFLGADVTPIVVSATAGLFGESKICVLALSGAGTGAVSMTKKSSLRAASCTVYSNSSNSSGVYMGDNSSIEAERVCSVGGVKDNGSVNAKNVVTDCPVLDDPLKSRPVPTYGSCEFSKTEFKTGTHFLDPGVYCGGVYVTGDAVVTMTGGDYIFNNGPLIVADDATLKGSDVGMFMTGTFGLLHFKDNAKIDLNGRETGSMAGMLIFDDPNQNGTLRFHSISATNATNLTGTIYMRNSNFIVDPAATVGVDSAYTAIVAKRLIIVGGPTLVLNSNYDKTTVPVPAGIRSSTDVHLIK